MTDLDRFFRHLVNTLAGIDPARLRQPLSLGDIRGSILPYRTHRRALQLESSEDYELLLMRLCAGEGGLAHTGEDDVRAAFRAELSSPNPDLSLVELHPNASVTLDQASVAGSLDHKPELVFAPPPEAEATPGDSNGPRKDSAADRQPSSLQPDHAPAPPGRCGRCGIGLPPKRVVNFCPQCGYNLQPRRCPSCALELEPGWRHCVGCGATVSTSS